VEMSEDLENGEDLGALLFVILWEEGFVYFKINSVFHQYQLSARTN
jgi:hypothetical protein